MIEYAKKRLTESYAFRESHAGHFKTFEKAGYTGTVDRISMPGFGDASFLTLSRPEVNADGEGASASTGSVSLEAVIITPKRLDAPLLTMEFIHRGEELQFLCEFFDIQLNIFSFCAIEQLKMEYEFMKEDVPKECWYDTARYPASIFKRGTGIDETCEEIGQRYLDYYLDVVRTATVCSVSSKQARIDAFLKELVEKGGVVLDDFRDVLPEEETYEKTREVLF